MQQWLKQPAVNNEYVDVVIEASQPLPKKMAIKVVGRYLYYRLRNVFVSGLVKEVLLRSDENFIRSFLDLIELGYELSRAISRS